MTMLRIYFLGHTYENLFDIGNRVYNYLMYGRVYSGVAHVILELNNRAYELCADGFYLYPSLGNGVCQNTVAVFSTRLSYEVGKIAENYLETFTTIDISLEIWEVLRYSLALKINPKLCGRTPFTCTTPAWVILETFVSKEYLPLDRHTPHGLLCVCQQLSSEGLGKLWVRSPIE